MQAIDTLLGNAPLPVGSRCLSDQPERFAIHTPKGTVRCRILVNAAGNGAALISHMAGAEEFKLAWRQGQHRRARQGTARPHATLPPCPTPISKGRHRHGNRTRQHRHHRNGGTARARRPRHLRGRCRDATRRSPQARADLDTPASRAHVRRGPRGHRGAERFHDRPLRRPSRYVPCRGHSTPGVASAPAIAERMDRVLHDTGLDLEKRPDWNPMRRAPEDFDRSSPQHQAELIEHDPAWGRIVCRCETVPEAEIVQAIRRSPGAVSVEGVKRRCRAGMGRCQSGFCQSRVVHILARELGCEPSAVPLEDRGSWIVDGTLKEGR